MPPVSSKKPGTCPASADAEPSSASFLCGQLRTGQRTGSGTKLFYPACSPSGKPVLARQLRGPHFSRCPTPSPGPPPDELHRDGGSPSPPSGRELIHYSQLPDAQLLGKTSELVYAHRDATAGWRRAQLCASPCYISAGRARPQSPFWARTAGTPDQQTLLPREAF